MLDQAKHEIILKNILRGIYQHPVLQTQLAFKGGSCLYFFYGLPRFSTDLDFSLVSGASIAEFVPDPLESILNEYISIREASDKRFTWFWSGNYERRLQNVKVEVSKRSFSDQYDIKDFLGVSVRTLELGTMFAHKLCAITDRRQMVNRDLYDTWWLLKQIAPIREEIIQERTGKNLIMYLNELPKYLIKHVDQRHIVAGLGELLDRSQKDWVRDHLFDDLLAQIQLRVAAESK